MFHFSFNNLKFPNVMLLASFLRNFEVFGWEITAYIGGKQGKKKVNKI
jgi:hypothetical protein